MIVILFHKLSNCKILMEEILMKRIILTSIGLILFLFLNQVNASDTSSSSESDAAENSISTSLMNAPAAAITTNTNVPPTVSSPSLPNNPAVSANSTPNIPIVTDISSCENKPLDKREAEVCVGKMIGRLGDLYKFVASHGLGKHLGNLDDCAKMIFNSTGGKGSFFPKEESEFKAVFENATVTCQEPTNNRVVCTFKAAKDVCFLDQNLQSGGIAVQGNKGKHTIQFILRQDFGTLLTVFPIQ